MLVLAWATVFRMPFLSAEPVAVRQVEGAVRGFLMLRTADGTLIADGDMTQLMRGRQVTNRLVFHFKDGSVQDETAVFSQNGHFRLLSDHLVQKGPAFKRPTDLLVNPSTGLVTVTYREDNGKDKTVSSHMELPADLANGLVPILLKNLNPGSPSAMVSMVVATPKPLLVKLAISVDGEDSFSIAGASQKATRFVVKVDIPGVRGVLAPVLGKQPPDTYVWILGGTCPAFLKSEGPFFEGGPLWRIELTSPIWPKDSPQTADRKK